MDYSLDNVEKLLKETDEYLQRLKQDRHNKKIGYSSKCKVCNCEWLNEIEDLRENGYTLEQIQQELSLHDISIMSLSRHFKNHYPKSQRYKQEQQLQVLENIKRAYLNYPFLEEYFKDKPLEYLERFNQEDGFCMDKFCLCNLVTASTVTNGYENIHNIYKEEIEEINELNQSTYSFLNRKEDTNYIKVKYLDKVNICLNCKNQILEDRVNLLERIITYNFLNITPDNKEIYFNLLQFDGDKDKFIQKLTEIKNDTPAK